MSELIFISHAWGNDNLNRDNHQRCKLLYNKLLSKGYKLWFDENDLCGNIDSAIMKGINSSKIVLICLTEKYCDKINNAVHMQTPNDNCFKEWNYSLFKNKIIIPIIMEPKMNQIFINGDGVIQMYLNSTLFIDMTNNINDDFELLCKTLRKYHIYTKSEKKFYKIKPNNSFDNLVYQFSNAIKNISPRKSPLSSPHSSPHSSPNKKLLYIQKHKFKNNLFKLITYNKLNKQKSFRAYIKI